MPRVWILFATVQLADRSEDWKAHQAQLKTRRRIIS